MSFQAKTFGWLLFIAGFSYTCFPSSTHAVKYYFNSENIANVGNASPTWGNGEFDNSLAYDSNGTPYVSYWNRVPDRLILAKKTGGVWSSEIVANGGSGIGYMNRLIIDANDDPRIVFNDRSGDILRYAKKSGGVWTIQNVDSGGFYPSIGLTSSGDPRISSWQIASNLRFASYNGSSWSLETLDTGSSLGRFTSLKMNGDNPIISYVDSDLNDIKVATYNGSSWSIETAYNTAGGHQEIELTSGGDLRIATYDGNTNGLGYLSKTGGVWSFESVDNAGFVSEISLVLNANNDPRIVYYSSAGGSKLKLAQKNGSTWTVETLFSLSSAQAWPSVAFDADGNLTFTYLNNATQNLYYVTSEEGNLLGGQANNVDLNGGSGTANGITLSVNATTDGRIRQEAYANEGSFLADPMVGDIFSMMDLVVDDATLNGTHTLTFNYTGVLSHPDFIAGGYTEEMLQIFHINGGNVEQLPVLSRNLAGNTITVTTTGFSPFGIGVNPEPATLLLLGSGLLGLIPFRKKHLRRS